MFSLKLALAALGLYTAVSTTSAAIDPNKPLVTDIFTADPSAHVFNGKVYVYPSHDRNNTIGNNDQGDHYDMVDYHVLSMDKVGGPVKDNGVALKLEDIPWALKQLWAPDAQYRNGVYYLFFPAKDKDGIFRIGVSTSKSPVGPFTADPKPIPGSYSIDPAVFCDDDCVCYMIFGGLWGGQLQNWIGGTYNASTPNEPLANGTKALGPRVAIMSEDLHTFKTKVHEITILDEAGKPLVAEDHTHRFFEASWMHKYKGKYYLSYSTGDTHLMVYAIGNSPLGPFTYAGVILEPVVGWTTHGSIIEFQGHWYLFFADSTCSGGVDYLRCVKVREIWYDADGKIVLTPPTKKTK